MKLSKKVLGFLGFLVFAACSRTSNVPEHLNGVDLGLYKIDKLHYLFKNDGYAELEEEFIPKFSSDKYELRLFFPSLKNVRKDSVFTVQKESIIDLLNGMKLSLVDLNLDEEIIRLDITADNFFDNISFNRNPDKPLSCWLSPHLLLNKKHKYKVKLFIPMDTKVEKKYLDMLFVIGIGKPPAL